MGKHAPVTRLHEERIDQEVGDFVRYCLREVLVEILCEQESVEAQLQAVAPDAELAGGAAAQVEADLGCFEVAAKTGVGFLHARVRLFDDLFFLSFVDF
mgnify:CR=1 FL=1